MKIAVRYYSRGGNTKKIAETIAKAAGVEAKTTDEPLKEDVDILFLGSALYGFDVDDKVKNFIGGINVSVGKVANFCTTAVVKSNRKQIAKLLAEKNIPLAEKEFACRGSFTVMHKGKPDSGDCAAAEEFAKKILSEGN
ncbi:MAG: flavodoxin [Ruminococcus sp.]|nr:flavodoxin [Ruminococcus sp.]MCM1381353.1 hypothetical protein [Muribaculaceae bacterium]MCM1479578.1 hypothetical protein [Muribaculaceae bacterium]